MSKKKKSSTPALNFWKRLRDLWVILPPGWSMKKKDERR